MIEQLDRLGVVWWEYVAEASVRFAIVAIAALLIVRVGRRLPSPWRHALVVVALLVPIVPPTGSLPTGLMPVPSVAAPVTLFPDVPARVAPKASVGLPATTVTLPPPAFRETLPVANPAPVVVREASLDLRWTTWLMLCYAAGVIVAAVWVLLQWRGLGRCVRASTPVREGWLHERVRLSLDVWRLRAIELRESPTAAAPMACGLIRRRILVPQSLARDLTADEIDAVLRHEIAHHRRRDLWVNLLQLAVRVAFWFHPLVHALGLELKALREECCDDLVLGQGATSAGVYGNALIKVARRASAVGGALAMTEGRHPLASRLRAIMDARKARVRRVGLAGSLLIATLAWLALPGAARPHGEPAQELPAREAAQASPRDADALSMWLPIARDPRSPQRREAILKLREMTWASEQIVPVLGAIVAYEHAQHEIHGVALYALGNMGRAAVPVLEQVLQSPDTRTREIAHHHLAKVREEMGLEGYSDYFSRLVNADLFAPSVRTYLQRAKGAVNLQAPHELTQRVKAAWRKSLAEHADPARALELARLIQDQLWGTDLKFSQNSDVGFGPPWAREDPGENYQTLSDILQVGFGCAELGSQLHRTLGIALAKTHLLRGRWTDMNQLLEQVGEKAIDATDVPWLCAPPTDWTHVHDSWGPCDASMREGDREIVFTFTKDNQPLAGVHVLLKRKPPESNVQSTGVHADTLFYATTPLPAFFDDSFGYRGKDRSQTRYAVSDVNGEARFARVADMPLLVEVLVPTSNFTEKASRWNLARISANRMTLLQIGQLALGPDDFRDQAHPRFAVLPDLDFTVGELEAIDPKNLALRWTGADHARTLGATAFELTLALSCPDPRAYDVSAAPVLCEVKRAVDGDTWSPSDEDRARLAPGNIYIVSLAARNAEGLTVAQWGKTRVYVPWQHRTTQPPVRFGGGPRTVPPIERRNWWQCSFRYPDGTQEDLRQCVERYLREQPDAFEADYVRVVKAWLDWHDDRRELAHAQLAALERELPAGNVARETALKLLADLDARKAAEKAMELCGAPW